MFTWMNEARIHVAVCNALHTFILESLNMCRSQSFSTLNTTRTVPIIRYFKQIIFTVKPKKRIRDKIKTRRRHYLIIIINIRLLNTHKIK